MKCTYHEITIREAVPADAPQLCTWWNDGSIMAHAGFPHGLGITVEKIIAQVSDHSTKHYRHVIEYQGRLIGEMNYRETEPQICEIGIKICDASMQNRGLGKIILSLFIHTLFNEYGYRKIVLDTNLTNARAQHVYEQLGFQKLRVNIDSWKDQLGNMQSSVDYELTEDSFISFLATPGIQ